MSLRMRAVSAAMIAAASIGLALVAPGSAAADQVATVAPGDGLIAHNADDTSTRCTLGLVGHLRDTDQKIGITAGHCFAPGQAVYTPGGAALGTVISQESEGSDLSDLSGYTMIAFNSGVNVSTHTIHGTAVRGSGDYQGDPEACTFGDTTGRMCGTIDSTAVSATRVDAHMQVEPGDSGGPVVEYKTGDTDKGADATFAIVGMTVRGGDGKVTSFNPIANVVANINSHFKRPWGYYVYVPASTNAD